MIVLRLHTWLHDWLFRTSSFAVNATKLINFQVTTSTLAHQSQNFCNSLTLTINNEWGIPKRKHAIYFFSTDRFNSNECVTHHFFTQRVSLIWRQLVNCALHPLQSIAKYSLYNCVHLFAPKRSLINANQRIMQPGGQQQHTHVVMFTTSQDTWKARM